MKTLIVYYSFTDNNKVLANELALKLNADVEQILEEDDRSFLKCLTDSFFDKFPFIQSSYHDPLEYDIVILIAPIWASKIASPMKSFLNLYGRDLKSHAFITVCGGGLKGPNPVEENLLRFTGKKPLIVSQLHKSELVPAKERKNIFKISKIKISKEELNSQFKHQVDVFVKKISQEISAT